MKTRMIGRPFAWFLALMLSLSLLLSAPALRVSAEDDPLALPADPTATITVKTADGASISVKAWEDLVYAAKPTDINFHFPPTPENPTIETTQLLNLYVPATANEGSPIILFVENGGWFTNTSPVKLTDGMTLPANDGNTAAMAAAFKAGYLVATYSCRGRNDSPNDGSYLGHSPATMTDTKAVIRYLRYNDAVIPGDSDLIVVSGTSGGGALSSILAASGDSADFYPSLYEIGAAGMTSATTSELSDAVFATIAYCPITDLPHADQAYEWLYGPVREAYKEAGLSLDDINPSPTAMGAPTGVDQVYGDSVLAASKELAADYVIYFNGLGLKDESGAVLKADDGSFEAALIALMEKSVEKELTGAFPSSDAAPAAGDYGWLSLNDGKAAIDWNDYLYWIGTEKTGLKTAPAFSNRGTPNAHPALNEDNIFGAADQAYSPFEFWSWNNHSAADITVGKNNTNLDWEAHLKTPAGAALQLQMKMTNPIPYLMSATEGKSAPHWYVRHGMADRDTSFAVEALLYYTLINDPSVEDVDFSFAWIKGHSGNYDVPEAYAWLAGVLADEGYVSNPFTDVAASNWFYGDVVSAYTSGLIDGKTATSFEPGSSLTYAEAVKLAACMHQKYTAGAVTLENGSPWYQSYADYAKENGIITEDYDWNAAATRAGYMEIFAAALPDSALAAKNTTIDDGAIPDVPATHENAGAIYKLYRAGVVQGVDDAHNCSPDSAIQRSEVAAILTRMMDSETRVAFEI
jgi:hypothetical protein